MIEEIKKLLGVTDANGDFVLSVESVAKVTGKHRNSIYESRKGDYKLDKLAIFEKIKELVENEVQNETQVNGNKASVIDGLNGVLKDNTRYKIIIKEI